MRKILILALVLIPLILLSVFIYNKFLSQKYIQTSPQNVIPTVFNQNLKTFKSSTMDFTVQIPNYYQATEKLTYVDLKSDNGLVDVVRNRTNFNSLDEYLKDTDSRKKLSIFSRENLEINGYNAESRIEQNKDSGVKQKVYYIFVDGSVYIISTKIESLYSDLDQIAQSFKYTP